MDGATAGELAPFVKNGWGVPPLVQVAESARGQLDARATTQAARKSPAEWATAPARAVWPKISNLAT
eukprot:4161642-Lingulodinium_polyedra.AAC.1